MANAVLGRAPELLVAGRFVESLTSGPAACVFVGDAGIGKTALWRDTVAAARAGGAYVLECAPTEVETALAYSSLADLFSGIEPPVFAGLPAPQRETLEVALLRAGTSDAVGTARGCDGDHLGDDRACHVEPGARCRRRHPMARPAVRKGARSQAGGRNITEDSYSQMIPLQDLLTLTTAGSVSLTCNGFSGIAIGGKITAIQVSALHG